MKKSFFYAICVMVLATIVAVVSCKKDKQEETTEKCEQCAQATDNMDEYLISFKKKLLSAEKGGETISLEQAERDLGNLLNFDFGDANHATDEFRYDTIRAKVSVDGEHVSCSDLATAYQSLFEGISGAFGVIDLPEKSVHSISCTIGKSERSNEAEIETVLVTRAYRGETAFDSLGWRAGNKAGRCDGYAAGFHGAPEHLENRLHRNMGTVGCPFGGRVYYTDETNCYKDANEQDMVDPTMPYGHKMFYCYDAVGLTNFDNLCISSGALDMYYNSIRVLFNLQHTFHPSPMPENHVVLHYDIDMHKKYWNGINKVGYWRLTIWHGKPNCTNTSPAV